MDEETAVRQPFYPNGLYNLIVTDIVGYGRRSREIQKHVRKNHYLVLAEALHAAEISRSACYVEDRGDGAIVITPEVATAQLVGPFVAELNASLRRHNQTMNDDARIRLRVVVHEGRVEWDGDGLVGRELDLACRLLDADQVKDLLRDSDAAMVYVASQHVFETVIQHAPQTVDPDDFMLVEVENKETVTRCWALLRGRTRPGFTSTPLVGGDSAPHFNRPVDTAGDAHFKRFQDVLESLTVEALRQRIRGYDVLLEDQRHTVDVFRQLARAYVDGSRLITESNEEQATLAYVLAEMSVIRQDVGLRRRDELSARIVDALRDDLSALSTRPSSMPVPERSALAQVVTESALDGTGVLAGVHGVADHPVVAFYFLFWGIAQLALLADRPRLFRADVHHMNVAVRSEYVIKVQPGGEQRIVLHVAVASRLDFEQLMEGWHLVDNYLLQVEDLWRLSGLIMPPMRITFQYPLWYNRNLDSAHFTVDPRPITRLLMGKALYGPRKHVWVRELVQNSIDAVETRRTLLGDADHASRIRIERLDSRHVVVADNGVGMQRQHIQAYLTTLGRSGWRATDLQEKLSDATFIGRFGIGFASVFGAAESVEVRTRS